MRRERDGLPRLGEMGREHADAIVEMRAILRERGMVSNRDFEMASRTRTQSYRGRKDSSLALYYLWRTGEVMTHHRERFERVYALTEQVAPAHLICESSEDEADRFLIKKEISFHRAIAGETHAAILTCAARRTAPPGRYCPGCWTMARSSRCRWRAGRRCTTPCRRSSGDAGAERRARARRRGRRWRPPRREEAVFLAPLDPVSARGRAKELFAFDYVWEVYKPGHQRKYGYYTLPVLWGDRLVARFDSKLDRATNTFIILGFWLEDETLANNEAFAEALQRGFGRFVTFLGADRLDASAIEEPMLRRSLEVFA